MRALSILIGAAFALAVSRCAGEPAELVRSIDAGSDAGSADEWPDVLHTSSPEVLASGLSEPCGLALGPNARLYVAEKAAGRVLALPRSGGAPSVLASGLSEPARIAVAGEDVFVTDRAAGKLVRIRAGQSVVLAENQANPGELAVDGTTLYWIVEGQSSADGALRSVSTEGGNATEIVAGMSAPRGLAIANGRAYFTESGSSAVGFVELATPGTPTRITDANGVPQGIAVDEASAEVFWASPGKKGGGFIHKAGLDLSGDTRLSFSPPGPSALWLLPEHVIWSTAYTLTRTSRSGGAYEDLVLQAPACGFVVADGALYFTESATGRVLREELK